MRKVTTTTIADTSDFRNQLLIWAQRYEHICWLDSNEHTDLYSQFDYLLAVDAANSIETSAPNAFEKLAHFQKINADWLFGFLSYDLKNELEDLSSTNKTGISFPDLFFFQPKKLFIIKNNICTQLYLPEQIDSAQNDFQEILETASTFSEFLEDKSGKCKIRIRVRKDEYSEQVSKMLAHIQRGDIYEANFCQEFYAKGNIDPLPTFQHLNGISKAPFASFFRKEKKYVLCSSPERYIQKVGSRVLSQPIKGTAPRGKDDVTDKAFAKALLNDAKERAENIMITDLVRNDLSKFAQKGSVTVTELCGVYPFKQVHQMISTIEAQVHATISPIEVVKSTFPMGSMTGAPKLSAMQIIEQLENTKRGLYSGSIGYFTPNGNFDFNVVIRSILYDQATRYISFSVGSAITSLALPEKEYEECLLKAKAMREVLE